MWISKGRGLKMNGSRGCGVGKIIKANLRRRTLCPCLRLVLLIDFERLVWFQTVLRLIYSFRYPFIYLLIPALIKGDKYLNFSLVKLTFPGNRIKRLFFEINFYGFHFFFFYFLSILLPKGKVTFFWSNFLFRKKKKKGKGCESLFFFFFVFFEFLRDSLNCHPAINLFNLFYLKQFLVSFFSSFLWLLIYLLDFIWNLRAFQDFYQLYKRTSYFSHFPSLPVGVSFPPPFTLFKVKSK